MNDFRYALRTLWASPGFTLIAVVTLALGIGANTAIFSVVRGVLLKPLPFADPDRIVRAATSTADEKDGSHSAADFRDLQRENQSLDAIAGYRALVFTVAAPGRDPLQLEGVFVTVDYFDVLGVSPEWGRTFTRITDGGRGGSLVVLSHQAARDVFGQAEQAVGAQLRVDGESHSVLGVLPLNGGWPERARLWVLARDDVPPSPVDLAKRDNEREVRYFDAIGRLKSGVSLTASARDLQRVAALIQQRHPAAAARRDIVVRRLRDDIVGDVQFGLIVLQAAVGLVLLIACANVSSLTIARASGRRRELAIRAAIGAGRWQLMRQLLVESTVLAMIGGWVGLLLGAWLTSVMQNVLPTTVPRTQEIGFDLAVAGATFATALASAVVFGVLPAARASRAEAAAALKVGDRGSSRAGSRAVLVAAEIALTVVLLAGAGLLLNSLMRLHRIESGMRPEGVTTMGLMLPRSRYASSAAQTELYRRVLEGVIDHPQVEAAGVGFPGPLRANNASTSFIVEGRATTDASRRPFAYLGSVSGGYFAALGIPHVGGRTFAETDSADAPRVAIVNSALARKYWPGENPIGKRLRFADAPENSWSTIVGIVGDARQLGLAREAPPILYFPYQQFPLPFTEFTIRSDAPAVVVPLLRQRLREVDPDLPMGTVRTLDAVLERSLALPRFRTILIGAFAVLAVVLAAVGVFGLVSQSVAQRTREVGIRMALGADPRRILVSVMREGLTLTVVGIALGLAGAVASARVIRSFLFGVEPADPLTLAVVASSLAAVAAVATYLPARRALSVDPVTALRAD